MESFDQPGAASRTAAAQADLYAAQARFAAAVLLRLNAGATIQDVVSQLFLELSPGMPEIARLDEEVRADARLWSHVALTPELIAYVAAGAEALAARGLSIEEQEVADIAARKLVVTGWKALSEPARKAFLARVDPRGVFQGRAA